MARKILKATEGMILTDGENFGRVIYLAVGADANAWYEITEEEYQKIMEEREKEQL